jgi:hypothetical protein
MGSKLFDALRRGGWAAVVVAVALAAWCSAAGAQTPNYWQRLANLNQPRELAGSYVLSDGTVLVLAGSTFSGHYEGIPPYVDERYDPVTNRWRIVAAGRRFGVPAGPFVANLPDGRALVVSIVAQGVGSAIKFVRVAQLYDPVADAWADVPAPDDLGTVLVELADGRVLLIGLHSYVFDPASRSFTPVSPPTSGLPNPATLATRLPDGRVLAAGGTKSDSTGANVAEVFDPATSQWTPTDPPPLPLGALAVLADGRVLSTSGEVYDPANNAWKRVASPPSFAASGNPAVLRSGLVLVTGRRQIHLFQSIGAAALYNPQLDLWTSAAAPQDRYGPVFAQLHDDRILLAGGVSCSSDPKDDYACAFQSFTRSDSEAYQPPNSRPVLRGLRVRALGTKPATRRLRVAFQLNEPDRTTVQVEQLRRRACPRTAKPTRSCPTWERHGVRVIFSGSAGKNLRTVSPRTLRAHFGPGYYRITLQPEPVGWPARSARVTLNL